MTAKKVQLTVRENDALKIIRSSFLKYGRGISVRELTREMDFGSTRTAALLLNGLIKRGVLGRKNDGSLRITKDPVESDINARTVNVPLVGTISCGAPVFAEENIEAHIPISVSLAKPGFRYFLLRASGDSMNKAGIEDGDFVLVRQQPTADNGQRVVALIDDEATVKEIEFTKDVVILKPRSKNKDHQPIILDHDFQVQGVVVATLPADTIEH
ncbi:MAG: transcriptional repressor LexA [Patescibacteria group bacterium]